MEVEVEVEVEVEEVAQHANNREDDQGAGGCIIHVLHSMSGGQ